jgi:hypothetical protein
MRAHAERIIYSTSHDALENESNALLFLDELPWQASNALSRLMIDTSSFSSLSHLDMISVFPNELVILGPIAPFWNPHSILMNLDVWSLRFR